MARETFAIRYEQTEEQKKRGEEPLYITYSREQFPQTGYGYCCGCKETEQYPSRKAAEAMIEKLGLSSSHEIIDSKTAAAEKRARQALVNKLKKAEDIQPELG